MSPQHPAHALIADRASFLVLTCDGGQPVLVVYPVRVMVGLPWREGAQGHNVGAQVVRALLTQPPLATFDLS